MAKGANDHFLAKRKTQPNKPTEPCQETLIKEPIPITTLWVVNKLVMHMVDN